MRQRWFNITDDGRHDIAVGLLRESQLELALSYMDTMVSEGIPIKSWLYDMAIYTLCDVEEVDEALKIMQRRVESGEQNISKPVWYILLDAASSVQNVSFHFHSNAGFSADNLLACGNRICLETPGWPRTCQTIIRHLFQHSCCRFASWRCRPGNRRFSCAERTERGVYATTL